MNKKETIQIITLLAGNYDSIAKKDIKQKEIMVTTWYECLKDLDYTVVLNAVKRVIITSQFPPTIHEIRKNAIELINAEQERSSLDAWNEAYSMICNGLYMTEEEYKSHSKEVQEFFGSLRQVKELATTSIDKVNTVTKGQFLKQYEVIQERKKEQMLLPSDIKEKIELLQDNSIKQIK